MRELANGKNCINYNIENLKKNDPKEMTFFRIQKRVNKKKLKFYNLYKKANIYKSF